MKTQNYSTIPQELLPCPFCGSRVEWYRSGNAFTRSQTITVKCPNCRVSRTDGIVNMSKTGHTIEWLEDKVIENWNRRTSND